MNPIAIEAQVLRELSPGDVVRAAARAGFEHAGVWIDPATWTAATTVDVRAAFGDTGVRPLDAEVIRIRGDVEDDQLRLLDIAGEIGVPHVIVVSLCPDRARTNATLAALAGHGAVANVGLVFEFGRFTAVPTVEAALAVVSGIDAGILPDPLHLQRSGDSPSSLRAVPAALIPFAQICDAGPAPEATHADALIEEARYDRFELGEGTLPLADFLAALPAGIPLSNETRSLKIEAAWPDPFERAAVLAARMRSWLGDMA